MAVQRGRRHQVTLDGQTVWLDSMNEEIALKRFLDTYGFSGKWVRPTFGIKHNGKYYTPDFEFSVNDYGKTSRALIEVKEYRKNFTKDMAARMCAVARHHLTEYLYLYAVKADKWYRVIPRSGIVRETTPPLPGTIALKDLYQPSRFITKNFYGRKYSQSWLDGFTSLLFGIPAKRKRRRK